MDVYKKGIYNNELRELLLLHELPLATMITDQEQKTIQQIPELQGQLAPSTDSKASGPGPIEMNGITEYKKDPDDGGHISHLARRLNDLSFMDPNHKK